jgi:hypothetical protein
MEALGPGVSESRAAIGSVKPGCLVELDDANTLCALDGWNSASIVPAILF